MASSVDLATAHAERLAPVDVPRGLGSSGHKRNYVGFGFDIPDCVVARQIYSDINSVLQTRSQVAWRSLVSS